MEYQIQIVKQKCKKYGQKVFYIIDVHDRQIFEASLEIKVFQLLECHDPKTSVIILVSTDRDKST